ncbi:MAG: DUF262 domain-containing protein [Treponema sp.]|nr:DUF262 domain-containing protein [Treponema sp.]
MRPLFEKNPTVWTISEFYDNYQTNKLKFEVGYQRESDIWDIDAKSYLIDSIMKNYPIPSIFLNPDVGNDGRTVYYVIDGKQRLQTIIGFIENKIPLPLFFANEEIFDKETEQLADQMAGKTFDQLSTKDKKFDVFIKQFWKYKLNIDMIYETNYDLVANLFDRLNRNGAPLNKQELRNAKYGKTELLNLIKFLANDAYWQDKLKKTTRMQNIEFISEIFFTALAGQVMATTNADLDKLYEKYKDQKDFNELKKSFDDVMKCLTKLPIDFNKYKRLCSPTHLYTLFSLAQVISRNGEKINIENINNFYEEYFYQYDEKKDYLYKYFTASSNGTHSLKCRQIRLEALINYCNKQ